MASRYFGIVIYLSFAMYLDPTHFCCCCCCAACAYARISPHWIILLLVFHVQGQREAKANRAAEAKARQDAEALKAAEAKAKRAADALLRQEAEAKEAAQARARRAAEALKRQEADAKAAAECRADKAGGRTAQAKGLQMRGEGARQERVAKEREDAEAAPAARQAEAPRYAKEAEAGLAIEQAEARRAAGALRAANKAEKRLAAEEARGAAEVEAEARRVAAVEEARRAAEVEEARREAEGAVDDDPLVCRVCCEPYDERRKLSMFCKCGMPESQHECVMCLQCLLELANATEGKDARCVCGRDKVIFKMWEPKM